VEYVLALVGLVSQKTTLQFAKPNSFSPLITNQSKFKKQGAPG
jgi:hypothetical protein